MHHCSKPLGYFHHTLTYVRMVHIMRVYPYGTTMHTHMVWVVVPYAYGAITTNMHVVMVRLLFIACINIANYIAN